MNSCDPQILYFLFLFHSHSMVIALAADHVMEDGDCCGGTDSDTIDVWWHGVVCWVEIDQISFVVYPEPILMAPLFDGDHELMIYSVICCLWCF